jgi:hypothetical protein
MISASPNHMALAIEVLPITSSSAWSTALFSDALLMVTPSGSKRAREPSSAPSGDSSFPQRKDPAIPSPLRLEKGILCNRKPLRASLFSQDIPHWVLGMKSADWESFNCTEYDSGSRPEIQAALARLAPKQRILANQTALLAQSHLTDIALISSSSHFLRSLLPLLPNALPLVIHCVRRSRRDPLLPACSPRYHLESG